MRPIVWWETSMNSCHSAYDRPKSLPIFVCVHEQHIIEPRTHTQMLNSPIFMILLFHAIFTPLTNNHKKTKFLSSKNAMFPTLIFAIWVGLP